MTPVLHSTDVKLLKTFVAVADSGGLSAAQVKLSRSLTAISSDLQALETRMGNRLCRRGRAGFALTEFGEQVLLASRTLFTALDRFQEDVLPSRDHLTGVLRLAVNEGQTTDPDFVLADALRRFTGRPRNAVRVGITIASFEQILEGLLNDSFDVGIGFLHFEHPRIDRVALCEELSLLYCGRDHPLYGASDAALTEGEVLPHPIVMRTTQAPAYYPSAFRDVAAAAIGPTPGARAYFVLSGRYLSFLAEHQARGWTSAGLMRAVKPDTLRFHTSMELAVKSSAERPRHVVAFLRDFAAAMAAAGHPSSASVDALAFGCAPVG